jgi:hypothetical protein
VLPLSYTTIIDKSRGNLEKIPENVMKGCTLGGIADKSSQAVTLYEIRTYDEFGRPPLS